MSNENKPFISENRKKKIKVDSTRIKAIFFTNEGTCTRNSSVWFFEIVKENCQSLQHKFDVACPLYMDR